MEPLSVKHQYKGKFTTDMSNLNLLTVPVGPDLPPQPVALKKEAANVPEVVYTYDVKWEFSEIKRARMSRGGQRPGAWSLEPGAWGLWPAASGRAGGCEYPARSASPRAAAAAVTAGRVWGGSGCAFIVWGGALGRSRAVRLPVFAPRPAPPRLLPPPHPTPPPPCTS